MPTLRELWENNYLSKPSGTFSWNQEIPAASLYFFRKYVVDIKGPVIDVGGGDSHLVDHLLKEGYQDITVLDIAQSAIKGVQERLGEQAKQIKWIVSDILEWEPTKTYAVWHDRAAFHFLTQPKKIQQYLTLVRHCVTGLLIMGTFSTEGPDKCSGLPVQQYDEQRMRTLIEPLGFEFLESLREDHITPSGNKQNFIFCGFQKNAAPAKNGKS
ncbi:MAG: hypothetical protein RL732_170 [Bacteroidota bacterium]